LPKQNSRSVFDRPAVRPEAIRGHAGRGGPAKEEERTYLANTRAQRPREVGGRFPGRRGTQQKWSANRPQVLPHGRTLGRSTGAYAPRRIGNNGFRPARNRGEQPFSSFGSGQISESIRRCCSVATSPEIIHRSRTRSGSGISFNSKPHALSSFSTMSTNGFQQYCFFVQSVTYGHGTVGNLCINRRSHEM